MAENPEAVRERQQRAARLDREQGIISERFEMAGWIAVIMVQAIFTYFIFNYAVALYNNIGEDSQDEFIIEWVKNRLIALVGTDFKRPISLLAQRYILQLLCKMFLAEIVLFSILEVEVDKVSVAMSQTLSVIINDGLNSGEEFAEIRYDITDDSVSGFE